MNGDRDLERCLELARAHAEAAHTAADAALQGGASDALRRRALFEVSQALAFDPSNVDAMRTLIRLVAEPR